MDRYGMIFDTFGLRADTARTCPSSKRNWTSCSLSLSPSGTTSFTFLNAAGSSRIGAGAAGEDAAAGADAAAAGAEGVAAVERPGLAADDVRGVVGAAGGAGGAGEGDGAGG